MTEKKKLLYVVRYQLDQSFNLKTKFDGQLRAFENLGFDVYYLAFDAEHFYLMHGTEKEKIGKTRFHIPMYMHSLLYRDLYLLAGRVLQTVKIDCVYWRSAPCWDTARELAKAVKSKDAVLIYEYPTYPQKKEKQQNILRKIFIYCSAVWKKKIEMLVDGFVLIGEEAGGTYNGKPAVNISNGVSLETIPPRNRSIDPDTIHILALASMSYWHGYDRLIRSLAAYDGDRNVKIHMVGGNDGGALTEWQALTEELGLSDKVIFHGAKNGAELDELFDMCDVGVNSLGMYRKGFSVTYELKAREYAARGLPFVCSVDDPALLHDREPMWLRVPNDDSIPDMREITAFALQMRADTEIVQKLRSYTAEHLTWESQYRKVFDRIEV